MKAFLLAAGEESRLWPLTDRSPKCLVPIKEKLYQNLGQDEKVLWGALGAVLPDAERVLMQEGKLENKEQKNKRE